MTRDNRPAPNRVTEWRTDGRLVIRPSVTPLTTLKTQWLTISCKIIEKIFRKILDKGGVQCIIFATSNFDNHEIYTWEVPRTKDAIHLPKLWQKGTIYTIYWHPNGKIYRGRCGDLQPHRQVRVSQATKWCVGVQYNACAYLKRGLYKTSNYF